MRVEKICCEHKTALAEIKDIGFARLYHYHRGRPPYEVLQRMLNGNFMWRRGLGIQRERRYHNSIGTIRIETGAIAMKDEIKLVVMLTHHDFTIPLMPNIMRIRRRYSTTSIRSIPAICTRFSLM